MIIYGSLSDFTWNTNCRCINFLRLSSITGEIFNWSKLGNCLQLIVNSSKFVMRYRLLKNYSSKYMCNIISFYKSNYF
jgi:hypothetical protein